MSEDYDICDDPCEKCGHPETRRRDCTEIDCDDGYYHDCMEDCCNCLNPEPNRRCDECGGHGVVMWCPHCGWEPLRKCYMNGVDQRLLAKTPNSALTEGGPVSVDCKSKPNPPFGAANGSQKL
jgi:hypothetical protein